MTEQLAQFFKNATEYSGNEGEIYPNYSGRGMMGETTAGFVCQSLPLLLADVILYLKETGLDGNIGILEKIPDFESFRTDNIGRDTIIY